MKEFRGTMPSLGARVLFALSVLVVAGSGGVAAEKREGLVTDPETGLIRKVVAGSNKIKAYTKPDDASPPAFDLQLLQPYYVMEESGAYLKVTSIRAQTLDEADKGDVGYVRADQVHAWATREALHFLPFTLSKDRNPVQAWDDEEKIRKFFETGDKVSFAASFEENVKTTLAREKAMRPYPVLDSFTTKFMGRTEKRIYHVLLPATITPKTVAKIETADVEKVRKTLESVTFCVVFDATGSMASIANEVADELIDAIKSAVSGLLTDTRIGFVFFRDADDQEKSLIVPAADVETAAKRLRDYAVKMAGGGDDAEPVLDALYMAAELFDWSTDEAQKGAKRVVLAVLNADAKPLTTGAINDSVPASQTPVDVANLLLDSNITAITVQAGPVAGANLESVLRRVADDTGGVFIPWAPGLESHIGVAVKKSVQGEAKTAREEADKLLGEAEIVSDSIVIPLKVLDGEKLERLREAGVKFNIDDRKGGILVQPGYLPENTDLLSAEIRIEKDTVQRLLNLFSVLSTTGLDATDLRASVEESIAAIAGERPNPKDDIAKIIKKKLGIQFRTELLSFNIEFLEGLTPKERLSLQRRIKEAADQLADFLDARTEEFDLKGAIWMPVGYMP